MNNDIKNNVMQKKTFTWPQTIGVSVIVLLLIAGVWTAVEMGPYLSGTVSRLATAAVTFTQTFIPGERLTLSTNLSTVTSGDEVVLSWTHRNQKAGGVYSLSYPCKEGVYEGVKVSSGGKMLTCDTPSDIYNEDNAVTLRVFSEATSPVEIPISLDYTNNDNLESLLSATINISVTNANGSTMPATALPAIETPPSPTKKLTTPVSTKNSGGTKTLTPGERTEKTYSLGTSSPASSAYGKMDLAPRILEIGVVDKVTNIFYATTSLKASDRIAVRFEVENLGTLDSGHWQFSAVLPTFPMHIFESEGQQSLAPGDKIEYVIGFDNVEIGVDGRFVINVDPTSSLSEASKTNNIATTTIRAN